MENFQDMFHTIICFLIEYVVIRAFMSRIFLIGKQTDTNTSGAAYTKAEAKVRSQQTDASPPMNSAFRRSIRANSYSIREATSVNIGRTFP